MTLYTTISRRIHHSFNGSWLGMWWSLRTPSSWCSRFSFSFLFISFHILPFKRMYALFSLSTPFLEWYLFAVVTWLLQYDHQTILSKFGLYCNSLLTVCFGLILSLCLFLLIHSSIHIEWASKPLPNCSLLSPSVHLFNLHLHLLCFVKSPEQIG